MEQLKHECGVVMIRLRKPIEYYKEKYGTYCYGIEKLYLMMEKQHNRGQEAAGVGVVKMHSLPGDEYVWRERALGSNAIQEIFGLITPKLNAIDVENMTAEDVERYAPFIGEIYMGHLRYSTTGKSGMSYVHPFLRRNNWPSRNLMMCGNFNLTNVKEVFDSIVARGQHPRLYSDTIVLLEQIGYGLDKENHRVYRECRDWLQEPALSRYIEDNIDMCRVLKDSSPEWDGGYVICGATGSGDMFVMRDPNGIRPAFYYYDDEVVVVASERPVIQTVFDRTIDEVHELTPGSAITVGKNNNISIQQIIPEKRNERCSFERIYFSRGSDADIYQERKDLGVNLVPNVLKSVGYDLDHTVVSFIPNTAEVAFIGMVQGLTKYMVQRKTSEIIRLQKEGKLDEEAIRKIMDSRVRVEKVAIKDIKLRTFIAEGQTRNGLAAHVYDITYGTVNAGEDNLVVIDDSIVRGTTLKQSILQMLGRLQPKKIVVVSSSPQVRYPDYYGIDMSRMGEFIAFRAAVELLKETGRGHILDEVYARCKEQEKLPDSELVNCVKAVYEPFTDEDVARKIAELLTPADCPAEVELVFQTIEDMHKAIPNHPGDWYFSGNYPTPGGIRLVNQAFINFYEGAVDKRSV